MQIKQLEIYGYGKWVDRTFNLSDGFHSFLGENEAGKSTLMSFIHSILFGFPTRSSVHLRYEPKESSKYGGKILIEDARFGEVIIERTHGKVTGDVIVTLEDGTTGSDELLQTLLNDIDQTTFQNIFSFSLTDIENVHRLSKNELSRYLFNIGAHGTEYYLELVDRLRDDANELYRPSGRVRPLNIKLAELEKQEQKLIELEKYNERYLELTQKNTEYDAKIKQVEIKQKSIEQKLTDIIELKKQWHIYDEIETLEKELTEIKLPPLKEDGSFLLAEYKKNLNEINSKIQELNINLTKQKEALSNPEMIEEYTKNKESIQQLEDDLPGTIELLSEYQVINDQITQKQTHLTMLENKLAIEDAISYPSSFSKEEITTTKQWIEQLEIEENKVIKLNEEIQMIENELKLRHQKLDQLEDMMWEKQELKEVEHQLKDAQSSKETEKPASTTSNWKLILNFVSAIIFLSGAFLLQSPISWLAGLLSLVFFVLSIVLFKKQSNKANKENVQEKENTTRFLSEQYEKQLVMREDWRTALSEIDEIQIELEQYRKNKEELDILQNSIKNNWENLLMNHNLSTTIPITQAQAVFEDTRELATLLVEDQKLRMKQAELKEKLNKRTHLIPEIIEINSDSITQRVTAFREYLTVAKKELAKEQEKLQLVDQTKQEMDQLEKNKENTKYKISHLFEATGAEDEEEFLELYQLKEEFDTKTSRLQFLKENTPKLDYYKSLPTEQEIQEQEEKLRTEIQNLEQQQKRNVRKQANIQLEIEKIEKDGTYAEELQKFENEKSIVQNLVDEWISNKLAAEMIKNTLNQVTKDRFAEIIADAENYFAVLTDGEYQKIAFKNDKLFIKDTQNDMIDVRVLSRGTAEPLYVAIRLAYIINTSDIMGLPIIMDDPFVNFDQDRKINMYKLIQKLSKDLQIIYFTFDTDVLEYFNIDTITQL